MTFAVERRCERFLGYACVPSGGNAHARCGIFLTVTRSHPMKLVMAIIKPAKLEAVREALVDAGITGLTSSEVSGFGRQKGHTEIYRGAEYAISFVPKTKVEVAVPDAQVDTAIEAIKTAANSGNIGDGKIFVLELGTAVRIRTGESGEEAL
jgi:nitrogen regulatory protein P-II 2